VRLRAAKLTRSSVYTLIGTPTTAQSITAPIGLPDASRGTRAAAVPAFCFRRVPASRAGRVHANEAQVRHFTSAVEMGFTSGTNGRRSARAFPDRPPFAPRAPPGERDELPPAAADEPGKKEESRVLGPGFPATDGRRTRHVRTYLLGDEIVKLEIARAIGTLKLQSRYKPYSMSHLRPGCCIMLLLAIRVNCR